LKEAEKHHLASIFQGFGRLILLPAKRGANAMEKRMEAKVWELVTLKSECEFFDLIEKKMKEQGFEVLETLKPKEEEKPRFSTTV
jgi:hypothetical protein